MMKTLHKYGARLLFLLLVFTYSTVSVAQTPPYYNYTPTTTTNAFPWSTAAGKGIQWIVNAGEFALPAPVAGTQNITEVWFYAASAINATYTSFSVQMGQISSNTDPAWTSATIYSGPMTTVINPATKVITTGAGTWFSMVLDVPFLYDPSQALIVYVSQCGFTGTSTQSASTFSSTGMRRKYLNPVACVQGYSGQDALISPIGLTLAPAGPPCNSAPSAGTITGPASMCPGGPVQLIATGYTFAPGVTFQWEQFNPLTSTWDPIPGATFAGYNGVAQATPTDYRFVATCINGGASNFSNTITVATDPSYLCYCSPLTGTAIHTATGNYITNVSIPGTPLNNPTTTVGAGGFTRTDPTIATQTASLIQVTPYTINVNVGAATYNVDLWIDYDQSGTFDAGEYTPLTTAGTTATGTINIPGTALTGLTGMRVRAYTTTGYGAAGACSSIATGFETEDYVLNILPAVQCTGTPGSGGVAVATKTSVCTGSNTSLSVSGYPLQLGITLQWEESLAGANSWSPIAGATNNTYTTGPLTASMDYRVLVTCTNGGFFTYSNTETVNVINPMITGSTPGTRCGTGTVNLSATGTPGSSISWYTAATGGAPIGSGGNFTTPVIGATTTFYAAANNGGSTVFGGSPAPVPTATGYSATTLPYGLVFDAFQPFTLVSVDVYSSAAAGSLTFVLASNTGAILQTFGPIPIPAGTGTTVGGGATATTIPINAAIAPGTGYRLFTTNLTATLIRENTGAYPYPLGSVGNVSTSWTNGAASSANYYFFYNWQVSTGCEGPRVPVVATITPPPAVSVAANPSTICTGSSSTLTATSANAYTYTWTPGGTGSTISVSPTSTTKYYLSAIDGNNCGVLDSVTVNVVSPPSSAATIATPTAVCVSGNVNLSLNPQPMAGISVQWQKNTGSGYVNIPGATATTYAEPVTASASYQAVFFCNSNQVGSSTPASVAYNNPSVLSVFPGSRCSTGQVALLAQSNPGATVKWYAAATGGSSLGTGNVFVTPSISSSTTYYAEASQGGGGPDSLAVPIANGTTTGTYFHMFLISTTTGMTIDKLSIKANQTIGTLTAWDIYYRPNNYQLVPGANTSSAGWTLLSSVTGVPSAGATTYTTIASNLNLVMPPASTYSFHIVPVAGATHQYATTATGTTTASNATASIISGHRGSLFNCTTAGGQAIMKVNYSVGCVGSRVPVAATINASPSATGLSTGGTVTGTLHADGTTIDYTDACNDKVATIADASGGNVLGITSATALTSASVQAFNGVAPYVPRVIDISPASSGPATVTLYILQSEFTAYNAYVTSNNLGLPLLPTSPTDIVGMNNIVITQFHGNALAGTTGPGGLYNASNASFIPNASITRSSNGTYWSLTFPVTGFSGFFVHTGATPLAVDLKSFTARNFGKRNRIDWTTAHEARGDNFQLERASDAANFTRLGSISGKGEASMYSYWDEDPLNGINYYRLKMVAASGSYTYSPVVSVLTKDGFSVLAYPNPATDVLTVQTFGTPSGNALMTITDVNGRVLKVLTAEGSEQSINIEGLASGVYLLVYSDDTHRETIKFTKQ